MLQKDRYPVDSAIHPSYNRHIEKTRYIELTQLPMHSRREKSSNGKNI